MLCRTLRKMAARPAYIVAASRAMSGTAASKPLRIGVIGGSGFYDIDGFEKIDEVSLSTPYGEPSDSFTITRLEGVDDVEIVFLPRHGRGHVLTPSEVNYRANIFGLKELGCSWCVAVTAVGSLQEEVEPGDFVLVSQFIDRTKHRKDTFFGDGIVSHVPFSDPICETARGYLKEACKAADAPYHFDDDVHGDRDHTLVCIEGPAFSTRAESHLYRAWHASVVGMTNLTEAKLAREAEMSFATLAMVTDYDCWHESHDAVTVEQVVATATANVQKAKSVVREFVPLVAAHEGDAPQSKAMRGACMTAPDKLPADRIKALQPLVGAYMQE